jgi:hypothetical protein
MSARLWRRCPHRRKWVFDRVDTVTTERDQLPPSHSRSTILKTAAVAFLSSPLLNGCEDVGDGVASGLCAQVSLAMNPNADSTRF